jgi:hypothetical protein
VVLDGEGLLSVPGRAGLRPSSMLSP